MALTMPEEIGADGRVDFIGFARFAGGNFMEHPPSMMIA